MIRIRKLARKSVAVAHKVWRTVKLFIKQVASRVKRLYERATTCPGYIWVGATALSLTALAIVAAPAAPVMLLLNIAVAALVYCLAYAIGYLVGCVASLRGWSTSREI